MKKKIFIVISILLIFSVCGYFFYQQRKAHYIIAGTEDALKKGMILPSSFKITEAVFTADDGKGNVFIKIIYKNQFGADTDCYMSLDFAASPISTNPTSQYEKQLYSIFKEDKKKVKDGKLLLEPFSKMSLVSASINDEKLSNTEFILLKTAIAIKENKYDGPSLGGKITELKEDGTHSFDFPLLKYIPSELFPYKRN